MNKFLFSPVPSHGVPSYPSRAHNGPQHKIRNEVADETQLNFARTKAGMHSLGAVTSNGIHAFRDAEISRLRASGAFVQNMILSWTGAFAFRAY